LFVLLTVYARLALKMPKSKEEEKKYNRERSRTFKANNPGYSNTVISTKRTIRIASYNNRDEEGRAKYMANQADSKWESTLMKTSSERIADGDITWTELQEIASGTLSVAQATDALKSSTSSGMSCFQSFRIADEIISVNRARLDTPGQKFDVMRFNSNNVDTEQYIGMRKPFRCTSDGSIPSHKEFAKLSCKLKAVWMDPIQQGVEW